jgi:hypothetical protein
MDVLGLALAAVGTKQEGATAKAFLQLLVHQMLAGGHWTCSWHNALHASAVYWCMVH